MADERVEDWCRVDGLLAEAAAAVHGDDQVDLLVEAQQIRLAEWARCRLADRLRATSTPVHATIAGEQVVGWVTDVGPDVVVLDDGRRRAILALRGVLMLTGLAPALADEASTVQASGRCTWSAHLRQLADEPIMLLRRDGARLAGTVIRASADHVEVRAATGAPATTTSHVIPYAAVDLITSPSRLGRRDVRRRTAA